MSSTVCSHTFTLFWLRKTCDRQNISNKFPCVCVCLSSGNLPFLGKGFPFVFLNISPTAILNLPTNSFCLLNTALALTSDNLLLNYPPSIPLATPWWHISKALVMPSLSSVHIHSLSSDWERRPCPSKYFDLVCMCLSCCDLFHFR